MIAKVAARWSFVSDRVLAPTESGPAAWLFMLSPRTTSGSAADRVFGIAMALAPPSAGACRTGSVILTAEPIAGHDAEGERREPGQDDPAAAGVLDLDPGPEMGTSPGSSSGPESGRRPCPGTPRRSRPPRPWPPGRRPMRLPTASIFLFRHHAERRRRAGRTRADPPICIGRRRVGLRPPAAQIG